MKKKFEMDDFASFTTVYCFDKEQYTIVKKRKIILNTIHSRNVVINKKSGEEKPLSAVYYNIRSVWSSGIMIAKRKNKNSDLHRI